MIRQPGPPVPWSDRERSLGARFFGTLLAAAQPRQTAAAFLSAPWRAGLTFAVLTYLPIALLSGVIPFSHTLGFGPSWAVTALGDATASEQAVDVLGAMLLGLLVSTARFGLLAAAYLSLAGAYGRAQPSAPGRQVLLYRAWLLPLSGASGLLISVVAWGMPSVQPELARFFAELVSLVPLVLLLAALIATARQALGIGPIASLAVVLVPFLAMFVVEPLLFRLLAPLLPSSEEMRQALEAAATTTT